MSKTHYKKLRNPDYIGAYELMQGDTNIDLDVTITNVRQEKLKTGDGSLGTVLYLKDQKPMIVNSTNGKVISKVVGSPYIEDWVGKQITLYVAKIDAFGEKGIDALRVRRKPVKAIDVSALLKITNLTELKAIANKNVRRLTDPQKEQVKARIAELAEKALKDV